MDELFSGKMVLVTGATGLLGGAVTRRLLQEGSRVRAAVRDLRRAQPLARQGAEIVQADMTDPASLERAVTGCQLVFHFAGILAGDYVRADTFHQVNVEGTVCLAKAAVAAGVERFIDASTAWVYGYAASPGTTERSPYRISQDLYIDTKIEAERRLQQLRLEQGLPLVIVQPGPVYGPGDRHWTLFPLRLIQARKMLLVDRGSGLVQLIFVDDAVEGILAAARLGRVGEAYLLCGAEVVTLHRYYGEFACMLGCKQISSIPGWMAFPIAATVEALAALIHRPPPYSRSMVRSSTMKASYDGSKACTELGFAPQISLEEGMARVAAWLKEEDPLGR